MDRLRPALEVAAFVLLPLAGGTVFLSCGDGSQEEQHDLAKRLIVTIFLFYLWILVCSLFLARIHPETFREEYAYYRNHLDLMTNFKPFKTIRLYIRCLIYDYIGTGIPLSNLIGNVVLFMPMSVFLPILFPAMRRFLPWLGVMVGMLVLTEALQFALCCGSCDIDDVILNLLGALAVYGLFRLPPVQRLLFRAQVLEPDRSRGTEQVGSKRRDPEEENEGKDPAEEPPSPGSAEFLLDEAESIDSLVSEEKQGNGAGTSM